MPSNWGPRIFWAVAFLLVALGVYAFFYEPSDDMGQISYAGSRINMVKVAPNLGACELVLDVKDRSQDEWKGEIKLTKGKLLQLYAVQAHPSSSFNGSRFDCKCNASEVSRQPVILRAVYEAGPDDSLVITLGKDSDTIPLSELTKGQPRVLFGERARLQATLPSQIMENDANTDDMLPSLYRDDKGNDYLLYLNAERSKGIDVGAVLQGSFESLETPMNGVTLRVSRFLERTWQYSEAATPKLDSCLDPVLAVDANGRIYVAWLQKNLEGWDLFYAFKDPSMSWNKPTKLNTKSGSYHHLVATSDSKGRVWLAWQTWLEDHYDIMAMVINDDKHLYRTPGLVAEHPRDQEGRWFPAIAADKQGNVFVAWSAFRQGRFELEVMKLFDNMKRDLPQVVVSSANDALRPSLVCDRENNLWLAYEESAPVKQFGDAQVRPGTISVRCLAADGKLFEWPLAMPAGKKERNTQPRLFLSSEGVPCVVFQSGTELFRNAWKESAFTAPKLLSSWQPGMMNHPAAMYQEGCMLGVHETVDHRQRIRLQFAFAPESTVAGITKKQPAPAPAEASTTWKPFSEVARLFRKRSDDLVLNKRYLLRGLVLIPEGVAQLGNDPACFSAFALEQGLFDWVIIPQDQRAPLSQLWQNCQRYDAMNILSDRNFLVGYYRNLMGMREPLLHVDTRKDEQPLPPLDQLEDYRRPNEKNTRINLSETTDRAMISQFLMQRQRMAFLLTDTWKLIPTLNQPGTNVSSDSIERSVMALWHPEAMPGTTPPLGMRVVAYAKGKSNDHLQDALKERNFYVATDDIYLIVRCDRRLPGDIFQTAFKPTISVIAQGTGKIKSVEILQDNKVVKSETPPGQAALLEFVNETVDRNWHSYTVKVIQENGAEAISQPMWIRATQ
ncbi:MAG: hypothetical protein U0796_06640 [Gemmatales bacterium]